MEKFSLNMVKSLLGRNVNLHLKDGSVIVNVRLTGISEDDFGRRRLVECVPYRENRKTLRIPLKSIAWAELINLNFIQVSD
ncbi:MAG: hypothetical protein ACUVT9_06710 [Candidatus Bathycorpusculaceae bacterium]